MTGEKKVFTNPCGESWDTMSGDERRRKCAICNKHVHNLTDDSLEKISSQYIDSGKCVKMNSDQVQFFQFFQSMSKVAGLTAALSLFPIAQAQAQDETPSTQFCVVTGTVKSNVVSNRKVFVVVHGRTIETRSADDGSFKLMIPKGMEIQHSNIRQLNNKTLEEDTVRVRNVRMPKQSTFIGTPTF